MPKYPNADQIRGRERETHKEKHTATQIRSEGEKQRTSLPNLTSAARGSRETQAVCDPGSREPQAAREPQARASPWLRATLVGTSPRSHW